MLIKTLHLRGIALAYAVAAAEGRVKLVKVPGAGLVQVMAYTRGSTLTRTTLSDAQFLFDHDSGGHYHPHTSWGLAGPIIERELISIREHTGGGDGFQASSRIGQGYGEGNTMLEAAMRCYVSMKLGQTVDVPEVLEG